MKSGNNGTGTMVSSVENIPTHLTHKPVIGCNYGDVIRKVSGRNETDKSDYDDAKYISIGRAQYNNYEASVKMMRYTGKRWSPQSEEVPIQRLPYMMVLLLAAIYKTQNPQEDCPCSDCINEEIVSPQDIPFLYDEIKEWGNYLKDGIEGVKALISRIDTSKLGE